MPQRYVSAAQAARALGQSDKTIRKWIRAGKMHADKPAANKLAIPVSEVSRMKAELARYADTPDTEASVPVRATPDLSVLEQTIAHLSEQVTHLRTEVSHVTTRLGRLEQRIQPAAERKGPHEVSAEFPQIGRRGERNEPQIPPPSVSIRTDTEVSTPGDLPADAVLARHFAEAHGVNPYTFRDHITKGIRGQRVEAIERPKPGRSHETERWLTPAQQQAALAFWDRHHVRYILSSSDQLPPGHVPFMAFVDTHGVNRNRAEQARKAGFIEVKGQALPHRGQHDVYVQFSKEPGFRTCDHCPHMS